VKPNVSNTLHGADGHAHRPQLLDQLLDGYPRPQREGQLHLIGLLVADQPLNLLFLLNGQSTAGPRRSAPPADTMLFTRRAGTTATSVNRAGVHIENRCDLLNALAFLPQVNGLLSQLLLNLGLSVRASIFPCTLYIILLLNCIYLFAGLIIRKFNTQISRQKPACRESGWKTCLSQSFQDLCCQGGLCKKVCSRIAGPRTWSQD